MQAAFFNCSEGDIIKITYRQRRESRLNKSDAIK
jgi:hypothetical protein